jgi:hypothetical protein
MPASVKLAQSSNQPTIYLQATMVRFFNILSFLSLVGLALPLRTTAQMILENTAVTSSSVERLKRWKYLGYFNETIELESSGQVRALYDGIMESIPIMTTRLCTRFCDSNGYIFAGVEYAQYVFCPILSILSVTAG